MRVGLMSDLQKVLDELEEIKNNPDLLNKNLDRYDEVLMEIIRIERRVLYGSKQISTAARLKQVEEYLDLKFKEFNDGEG